ncbi:MAG: metalloregulator ArsR/SmtB family transcription factor [Myxococcales bacterium]|nr:metalloregulator ArsR/SmtB family transcription factor [Myxococcales bacterium]
MTLPDSRTFKDAAYEHLAEVGKALSSRARLEILDLLTQAPRSVEALALELEQSVANTSHHLQALKRARLVRSRRAGLRMIYELDGEDVAGLLARLHEVARAHLAELERLSHDFFSARDGLEGVDPATLLARMRREEVILLDVRPSAEYEAGHLPGARSIPLAELEAQLDDLPRDRAIVAYCRGPYCALSADAARRLRALGFDAQRSDVSVSSWQRHSEGSPA